MSLITVTQLVAELNLTVKQVSIRIGLMAMQQRVKMEKRELIDNCCIALGVEPGSLDEKSSPDNTGSWDSMAWMSLIAMIYEKLRVVLDNKALKNFKELGDIVAVLEEKDLLE